MPLTICRSNADCVIGVADGIAVALWVYATKPADVTALTDAARSARSASGATVKLVQIVPETALTPDGRARDALAHMLRGLKGIVSHSAIVHEAEGFRAALIRSIVTGVVSLSNPGFPHRVFAKLPEAAAWLCTPNTALDPQRGDAQQIEMIVDRIRMGTGGAQILERRAKERAPTIEYR
jgi:hypothetical protein